MSTDVTGIRETVRREPHPDAARIFDLLWRLPEGDAWECWREVLRLRSVLAERPVTRLARRRQAALAAVIECARSLGQVPSQHDYTKWRAQQEGSYPSGSAVGAAFGGWAGVRSALGESPEFSSLGLTYRARGSRYSTTELAEIVHCLAQACGRPVLSYDLDYLPFARAQMTLPACDRVLPRFPRSRDPFSSDGRGGWATFLASVGLEATSAVSVAGLLPRRAWNDHRLVTQSELHEVVRLCWDQLQDERGAPQPPAWLGLSDFMSRWNALAEQDPQPVLSMSRVLQLSRDHWANALNAAGCIDERTRRQMIRARSRSDFSVAACVRAVLVATQAMEGTLTRPRYSAWRDEQHALAEDDSWILPSASTIAKVLGGGGFVRGVREAVSRAQSFEIADAMRSASPLDLSEAA
ncbi:MAG: hypothetical protein JWM31_840 [Solirubrobacterales bacterium]|nr:hypothetical protein [Solirubrobacterales bacterium]